MIRLPQVLPLAAERPAGSQPGASPRVLRDGPTRPERVKAVLLFRCAPMHTLFAVSAPLFAPCSLIYVKKGEKVGYF